MDSLRWSSAISCFLAMLMVASVSTAPAQGDENENAYWRGIAEDEINEALNAAQIKGVAKNVILFLGDGMGAPSVTAGRILAGQLQGQRGEEGKLSFDKFPFTGLSRTYNVDRQITDSAASGTAYLTGVKTRQGAIGVNGKITAEKCSTLTEDAKVTSILRWSEQAKKSTGLVTTTRITHATPAAAFAHSPYRYWESDRLVPEGEKACSDIALQLIENNSDIDVILGGGRAYFLPENATDPDPDLEFNSDKVSRQDGKDLIQIWQDKQKELGLSYKYVYNKQDFDAVDVQTTDKLLGLFAQDHMAYEVQRNKNKEPSIKEMTEKAIKILSKNENGFFLLVEGGRIDHGHHASQASKALHDVVAMAEAVEAATKLTSKEDTLIVVTADHSHVMSIAGYAKRGNDIFGLAEPAEDTYDTLPYTTLVYGNGPGFTKPRQNLTGVDTTDVEYMQQSAVPMHYETHGGEDVAIYALGPHAHLYSGVHEQNYIPMVMAYASCVGPMKGKCATPIPDSGLMIKPSSLLAIIPLLISSLLLN